MCRCSTQRRFWCDKQVSMTMNISNQWQKTHSGWEAQAETGILSVLFRWAAAAAATNNKDFDGWQLMWEDRLLRAVEEFVRRWNCSLTLDILVVIWLTVDSAFFNPTTCGEVGGHASNSIHCLNRSLSDVSVVNADFIVVCTRREKVEHSLRNIKQFCCQIIFTTISSQALDVEILFGVIVSVKSCNIHESMYLNEPFINLNILAA